MNECKDAGFFADIWYAKCPEAGKLAMEFCGRHFAVLLPTFWAPLSPPTELHGWLLTSGCFAVLPTPVPKRGTDLTSNYIGTLQHWCNSVGTRPCPHATWLNSWASAWLVLHMCDSQQRWGRGKILTSSLLPSSAAGKNNVFVYLFFLPYAQFGKRVAGFTGLRHQVIVIVEPFIFFASFLPTQEMGLFELHLNAA